ncbi:MAG: hypothetical protein ACK2U5_07800 [Candidatus Promineifilaceae bacterium]|jgi:hypothetical protein
MRDLQRISLALTTTFVLLQPTFADEVSDGEMAAAIRGTNYPCDHVLQMQSAGDNSWLVQCNSGTYQVSRDENGELTVVKANWPEG